MTKCSRSGQTMISTAQGLEGRPVGQADSFGTGGSEAKLIPPERFQQSGAGRGAVAEAPGAGRPRRRWWRPPCPPCSPGRRRQRSGAAPFRSLEDERAGEEGKGKPGESGGGGATPGAVPCSRVPEAGTRRRRMLTLHGRSPAPVGGAGDVSARLPSARLGFAGSCAQHCPEPQSQGVNLSGGAVAT